MMDSPPIPLVEVTRGGIIESIHFGSITACLADGSLLLAAGAQKTPFYLRSASKPFQALAFLERGGAEEYGLEPEEIALICASHFGTDRHMAVLNKLQKKVGITESMLQCGLHPPHDKETADRMEKEGVVLHPNRNNCSGKHTGMLAFAKMIGAPLETYLEPGHPVQEAILQTHAEMCGLPVKEMITGEDGCSAPVFAVPLKSAALAYARLCQPDALEEKRALACRKITASMSAHPFMVAGRGAFDTQGMRVGNGDFITKIGAEGFRGISILPDKARGFSSAVGICYKISDGDKSLRANSIIAMAVLEAFGLLDDKKREKLKGYGRRPITNRQNKAVGEIRPSGELVRVLERVRQ